MQKLIFKCIMLTFLFFFSSKTVYANQCKFRSGSVKIYISDSHIGMGGKCNVESDNCVGGWNNMEDFRWDNDFSLFINHLEGYINGKNNKSIDFIVVGDFLELWQNMGNIPCEDDAHVSDLSCNAEQALLRVQEVGRKHNELFKTLSYFIGRGKGNKIIILPGNHDATLSMDIVASSIKNLFTNEAGENVCIDEDGIIYDSDGVFVEHGHQIEGDLNRYTEPLNGTVECINRDGKAVNCNDDNAFVRRSWGENFVQNYYNDYENKFPVIDNYSAEGEGLPDGVKRGLSVSSLTQKSSAVLGFISFFFTKHTSDHYKSILGEKASVTHICENNDQKPCIDIDSMKQLTASDKIFTQLPSKGGELVKLIFSVPNIVEPKLQDVYAYYSGVDKDALSILDGIIITTCVYWDNRENGNNGIACSYKNRPLGAPFVRTKDWFKGILDQNYEKITNHIRQRERQFNIKIKNFIYGHTHSPEQRDTADGSKKILNTGAWQRVVSAEGMEKIVEKKSMNFKDMTPSFLPSCYSFAVSGYGEDYKNPTLLWWASEEEGENQKFRIYNDQGTPAHCMIH